MIVVVSNLLRSGSSMTCQMLSAGGMAVVGSWPAFEVELPKGTQNWMKNLDRDGPIAMKLIDPHTFRPPRGPEYKVIWLDRDVFQQAKSTVKSMRKIAGMSAHKSHVADMRRMLLEMRRPALEAWKNVGADILRLRFETFLSDYPRGAIDCAQRIKDFVGLDLDVEAMASVVVNRHPKCLPYMLETVQLKQRRTR